MKPNEVCIFFNFILYSVIQLDIVLRYASVGDVSVSIFGLVGDISFRIKWILLRRLRGRQRFIVAYRNSLNSPRYLFFPIHRIHARQLWPTSIFFLHIQQPVEYITHYRVRKKFSNTFFFFLHKFTKQTLEKLWLMMYAPGTTVRHNRRDSFLLNNTTLSDRIQKCCCRSSFPIKFRDEWVTAHHWHHRSLH